jgi:hypothetical protein
MRKAINDGLSHEQLRRIDQWMLLLLASILTITFLSALAFGGRFAPQFDARPLKSDLSEWKDQVRQTDRSEYFDRSSRDLIGTSKKLLRSEPPNGLQGLETLKRNGELRQNLPVLY